MNHPSPPNRGSVVYPVHELHTINESLQQKHSRAEHCTQDAAGLHTSDASRYRSRRIKGEGTYIDEVRSVVPIHLRSVFFVELRPSEAAVRTQLVPERSGEFCGMGS